jgi:hypothetical protein
MEIYSFCDKKSSLLNKARYESIEVEVHGDDLKAVTTNLKEGQLRGRNLNVGSEYSGDFQKITDIHFLKGTNFDRDFFRRMYPSINIRHKPETADLIVYDEKSLFSNDKVPKTYYKYNDVVFGYDTLSAMLTLREFIQNVSGGSYYYLKGTVKLVGDTCRLVDLANACYLKQYKVTHLVDRNEYFDTLAALSKPYLHVSNILKKMESSQRSNNLSLEELITLFDQVSSNNKNSIITALETLIMYDSEKYLPVQTLLLKYALEEKSEMTSAGSSKKLQIFCSTYSIRNEYSSMFSNINSFFGSFSSKIMGAASPNTDFEILSKFIRSPTFMSKIIEKSFGSTGSIKNISFGFDFVDERLNCWAPVEIPEATESAEIDEFLI